MCMHVCVCMPPPPPPLSLSLSLSLSLYLSLSPLSLALYVCVCVCDCASAHVVVLKDNAPNGDVRCQVCQTNRQQCNQSFFVSGPQVKPTRLRGSNLHTLADTTVCDTPTPPLEINLLVILPNLCQGQSAVDVIVTQSTRIVVLHSVCSLLISRADNDSSFVCHCKLNDLLIGNVSEGVINSTSLSNTLEYERRASI